MICRTKAALANRQSKIPGIERRELQLVIKFSVDKNITKKKYGKK